MPAGGPAAEPLFGVAVRRRRLPAHVAASHCGTCTRCIEACPTGAIASGGGLDAGSCISTWTIEWRGKAPPDRRSEQGGILFGCDICQAVCPWNQRAAENPDSPPVRSEYSALPAHAEIGLADLIELSDDGPGCELVDGNIPEAKGVGLRNTRERLATLYGAHHSIKLSQTDPHGLTICIRIPYTPKHAPA